MYFSNERVGNKVQSLLAQRYLIGVGVAPGGCAKRGGQRRDDGTLRWEKSFSVICLNISIRRIGIYLSLSLSKE